MQYQPRIYVIVTHSSGLKQYCCLYGKRFQKFELPMQNAEPANSSLFEIALDNWLVV